MPQAPSATPHVAPSRRGLWLAYAGLLAAVATLLGLSELQHYLALGGRHPWEPLLWEGSSVLCMGLLGIAVYRWHGRVLHAGGSWPRLLALHGLGALLFSLVHVGGMFGLRFAVYALAGLDYRPGGPLEVLAYETGKDLVSYTMMVAVCHGLRLFFAEQQRRQELDALRAELAETRLARLAEQVQPHFLFNTLNLISAVMHEDVERADRILCELATLLRQALAAEAAGSHSLEQELALVAPYLSIMQARFGERLTVAIEVSEEARRCTVPALLLLSPVENAIKHDVARNKGPVRVALRGQVLHGRLDLAISNSGSAPQRLEREGALGLANMRERLARLYGDAARLEFGAAGAAGGSLLSLSLPAQRDAAA
ncbi:hypothetical protein G8A07_25220 [Roseateles sp. DAIF2]|uniref:sensor histidine kinase n=1 Tax=Roseateles sp. DAIF2 TaxID=2714952 RepID=UPI0018A335C4|nr:histidine kinase [Roseateles sp. DAIF2]QPF75889.1 hypothetical protein G8A07_25220 [Roseateles sp. DAIF2]